jgi:hypothetical protein
MLRGKALKGSKHSCGFTARQGRQRSTGRKKDKQETAKLNDREYSLRMA